ncbi:MAG TPA: hypothetical protein VHN99_00275 [Deinococcales bacterium]|nr:hypothetical protein [Deinococcales bacterium]
MKPISVLATPLLAFALLACAGTNPEPREVLTLNVTSPVELVAWQGVVAFDAARLALAGQAPASGLIGRVGLHDGRLDLAAIAEAPRSGPVFTLRFESLPGQRGGTARLDSLYGYDDAGRRVNLVGTFRAAPGRLSPLAYTFPGPDQLQAGFAAFPLGDLNGNKLINVTDAVLSLDLAVGALSGPSDQQLYLGDLTGDGGWDVGDARAILAKIVRPGLAASGVVDSGNKAGIPLDTSGTTRLLLVGNAGNGTLTLSPTAPSGVTLTKVSGASDPGWAFTLKAAAGATGGDLDLGAGLAKIPVTVADTTPPNSVTIARQGSSGTLTAPGNVTFRVSAADNRDLKTLEVLQDGNVRGSSSVSGTSASHDFVLAFTPSQNGARVLSARATDASGNPASTSGAGNVTLNVDIPGLVLSRTDCSGGSCTLTVSTTGSAATDLQGLQFELTGASGLAFASPPAVLAGSAAVGANGCTLDGDATTRKFALACTQPLGAPGPVLTLALSNVAAGDTLTLGSVGFTDKNAADATGYPGDPLVLR